MGRTGRSGLGTDCSGRDQNFVRWQVIRFPPARERRARGGLPVLSILPSPREGTVLPCVRIRLDQSLLGRLSAGKF